MLLLALVSAVAGLAACGGTSQQAQVSSPFTEEHAKYFEQGLDFVVDPSTLDGHWRDDWQAELETRVSYSDLIARVKVEAVRTHWDLDRRMLQLDLSTVQRLYGVMPREGVQVSAHEGDTGYASVKSNETRMLNATYILFVKWYENDVGELVAHWHMSPDSEGTLSMVQSRIQLQHGSQEATR